MRSSIPLLAAVCAIAASPAAAFAPVGGAMPGLRSAPRAMSLKMADTEVTLGLSEPILGGNAQAKEIFGFLQSKTYSKDREGFILGDVFADGVVRNGGFSEFSEKVNGRVAQLAFPMGLMSTFDGDLLDQIAAHPVQVLLLSSIVLYASLPPLFDARTDDRRGVSVFKAAVPADVRTGMQDAYDASGLGKIFTEEAEITNSRAAMVAMGVWIVTATLFT